MRLPSVGTLGSVVARARPRASRGLLSLEREKDEKLGQVAPGQRFQFTHEITKWAQERY